MDIYGTSLFYSRVRKFKQYDNNLWIHNRSKDTEDIVCQIGWNNGTFTSYDKEEVKKVAKLIREAKGSIYDAIKFNIEHRTFNRTHYDELYDIKQKILNKFQSYMKEE